jgi:hypothetical protein
VIATVFVQLEDERGEKLERLDDGVHRFRLSIDDSASLCWRYIDEYGDTTFNRLQMPAFLNELAGLGVKAASSDRKVLDGIERLAISCRDSVHLYLKFYGD